MTSTASSCWEVVVVHNTACKDNYVELVPKENYLFVNILLAVKKCVALIELQDQKLGKITDDEYKRLSEYIVEQSSTLKNFWFVGKIVPLYYHLYKSGNHSLVMIRQKSILNDVADDIRDEAFIGRDEEDARESMIYRCTLVNICDDKNVLKILDKMGQNVVLVPSDDEFIKYT